MTSSDWIGLLPIAAAAAVFAAAMLGPRVAAAATALENRLFPITDDDVADFLAQARARAARARGGRHRRKDDPAP